MRYAIVIEGAGENFSAYVPELPGCTRRPILLMGHSAQVCFPARDDRDGGLID